VSRLTVNRTSPNVPVASVLTVWDARSPDYQRNPFLRGRIIFPARSTEQDFTRKLFCLWGEVSPCLQPARTPVFRHPLQRDVPSRITLPPKQLQQPRRLLALRARQGNQTFLRDECTGTCVTFRTKDMRYSPLRWFGLCFCMFVFVCKYPTSRRGRGNVGIPKGFPKSVGRVGSRLYGFPCFPHSVISMACSCFREAFMEGLSLA
jgi:hypothetical protein